MLLISAAICIVVGYLGGGGGGGGGDIGFRLKSASYLISRDM